MSHLSVAGKWSYNIVAEGTAEDGSRKRFSSKMVGIGDPGSNLCLFNGGFLASALIAVAAGAQRRASNPCYLA